MPRTEIIMCEEHGEVDCGCVNAERYELTFDGLGSGETPTGDGEE